MLMAIYGIIGELSNPGAILPGVVVASRLSSRSTWRRSAGEHRRVGVDRPGILFIVDIYATTHGADGGWHNILLGALMLFNKAEVGFQLLAYIIPGVAVTAAFFIFVGRDCGRNCCQCAWAGNDAGKTVEAISRIDERAERCL